jgi:serine/threonine protein kinase
MPDVAADHAALIAGRYQCGPVIGRGGMAEVWAGRDIRLDRPVAIKVLRAEMDHQPGVRRRFEAEARMAAQLVHPNVVTVFDSGEDRSRPFIVMERLSGWTLRDQLDQGRLSITAVHTLAEQILAALSAAHAAGILHRDIKPGNILIGPDGQWKVADFGIAKAAELPAADDTASGLVRGTPAYLAPERFYGAAATVQADLYALGAVLYESLAGHKPLQAPHNGAWATTALTMPPVPLRSARTGVDAALARAVERCLRKDPAERFLSAPDMMAALTPTSMEPTQVGTAGATIVLDATQPLPAKEQPQARRPWYRRGPVIGALAALAALSVLAAIVGFNLVGASSGRPAHHPPVPNTTPPPRPPTTPALSTPPVASVPAQTHPPGQGQHGGKGKAKGGGNGGDNSND